MSDNALLMTLSDVASLARVKRPVVSVWRTRASRSDTPFPPPVAEEGGVELFDAGSIAEWLSMTGRGNNPDAAADAAANLAFDRSVGGAATLEAITALLALRSMLGVPLTSLDQAEIVDAADENDPDDELLLREIEAIEPAAIQAYVAYTDALIEAAYSEGPAFEKLLNDRFKHGIRGLSDAAPEPPALRLLAQAANTIAETLPPAPVLVDPTGSSGDALHAIAESRDDFAVLPVLAADGDTTSVRLTRRRLLVHGIPRAPLPVDSNGAFSANGSALHVVTLPAASVPGISTEGMLALIDNVVLQMSDDQAGLVLAPATVLVDALSQPEAEHARSVILRTGRIRAIVRLPAGLIPRKPQQPLALWVLGAAHPTVEIAARWTLVADLTGMTLDDGVTEDLVTDLVAGLGSAAAVRAHAFRFARVVLTSTLLASRASLVAQSTPASVARRTLTAELAMRAEQLLAELDAGTTPHPLDIAVTVSPAGSGQHRGTASVQNLIADRNLRYLPGNRIEPDDLLDGAAASGIRVIGPDEVRGVVALGARVVDRLRFASAYPAGRLTEPGDVVFCTSPQPAAMVDRDGTSVVTHPARILRIDRSDPDGLVSDVLAADINALPPRDKQWRRWNLRRVPPQQRPSFEAALTRLHNERAELLHRLSTLDQLTDVFTTGVTRGDLLISTSDSATTSGPSVPESPMKGSI